MEVQIFVWFFFFLFFYLIGQPPEKEMEKLWKIGKGHLEEDPENVVIRARVRFSIQNFGEIHTRRMFFLGLILHGI